MAVRTAVAPPAPVGVNFLDLGMYVAGGGLPEGDYALEFNVQMYQAQSQQGVVSGPPRLGIMLTCHSLTDPSAQGDNARTQFYSMGTNADKSFAPNAATGKGLVPIPGAVGATLNQTTNWALLLKSLYDCGLPQGVASNDLSLLDGIHVHMSNVPEPEERKGFQSNKTGEAAAEDIKRKGTIAIVTEIKDDGKPWEGSGGIPAAAPAKPALVKPGLIKPKPVAVAAPPPTPPVDEGDEDIQTAAVNGLSAVLEKKPMGCTKIFLKTETFKATTAKDGEPMAQAVQGLINDDSNLGILLGSLGYAIKLGQVVPLPS